MKWVVDGKLRKWNGWVLGGLEKKMYSSAGENGASVAGNGEEVVRRLGVLEATQ